MSRTCVKFSVSRNQNSGTWGKFEKRGKKSALLERYSVGQYFTNTRFFSLHLTKSNFEPTRVLFVKKKANLKDRINKEGRRERKKGFPVTLKLL